MSAADRWSPLLGRRRLGGRPVWVLAVRDRRTRLETPVYVTESGQGARRRRLEMLDDLLLLGEDDFHDRWLKGTVPE